MLSDLDRLMRERELDALIVPMHEALHPVLSLDHARRESHARLRGQAAPDAIRS